MNMASPPQPPPPQQSIPPPPPPPPPPGGPPGGLIGATNGVKTGPPPPPPQPQPQPQANPNPMSNLAAALASAKLKKTPGADDKTGDTGSTGSESGSIGGNRTVGGGSLMDEMAKTLARRRAQAEADHVNGASPSKEDSRFV